MSGICKRMTIYGNPITKKNHSMIIQVKGRPMLIPSKQYKTYETDCLKQIVGSEGINEPVNLKCVYYMETKRRVDLVNLLEATCDILVKAGVLEDDNCKIVASHDGSRVDYDKENPRVEIWINNIQ